MLGHVILTASLITGVATSPSPPTSPTQLNPTRPNPTQKPLFLSLSLSLCTKTVSTWFEMSICTLMPYQPVYTYVTGDGPSSTGLANWWNMDESRVPLPSLHTIFLALITHNARVDSFFKSKIRKDKKIESNRQKNYCLVLVHPLNWVGITVNVLLCVLWKERGNLTNLLASFGLVLFKGFVLVLFLV